jgi:hypothetical protein
VREQVGHGSTYSCACTIFIFNGPLEPAGLPIKVVTVGGSITAGQGAPDAPNYPQWIFNHLEDHYGKQVSS